MEQRTTPQCPTCGGTANPTAQDGVSQWMGRVALAQCSYSSREFGICAALADAKISLPFPKLCSHHFTPGWQLQTGNSTRGAHPSSISAAELQLVGRKMLTCGKSLELYLSDPFFPYYFSSWRQEELLVGIERGLSQRLSPWRQLTDWHGASCQHPQGRGVWGGPRSAGFNYPYPYLHSSTYGGY